MIRARSPFTHVGFSGRHNGIHTRPVPVRSLRVAYEWDDPGQLTGKTFGKSLLAG
jgi:hypothetical protein